MKCGGKQAGNNWSAVQIFQQLRNRSCGDVAFFEVVVWETEKGEPCNLQRSSHRTMVAKKRV